MNQVLVPDEFEMRQCERLFEGKDGFFRKIGVEEDPIVPSVAIDIAKAKLGYVMENLTLSGDEIVFAADTVVRRRFTDFRGGRYNGGLERVYMKPKNKEEIENEARDFFVSFVEERRYNMEEMKKMGLRLNPDSENINRMLAGTLQDLRMTIMFMLANEIEVDTAVAVKLPGVEEIETFCSAVYLKPQTLMAISDGLITQYTAEDIASIAIKIMDMEKIDRTKIAGGIDYSNEKIRQLLHLEEISHDFSPVDIYKGMPKDATLDFLKKKSVSLANPSSDK